ncbi:MAG: amidohydrolase family protein [Acidobacteriota bacterium]
MSERVELPAGAQRVEADLVCLDGRLRSGQAVLIDADGRVLAAGPDEDVPSPPGVVRKRYPGVLLPGAVNAHSHAFQILLRGRSDRAADFRDWVDNYMYPLALGIDAEEIALGSRLAFAEMIRNGVTTVGEFFYLHNAPESEGCASRGNANALRVVREGLEVGIRVHLLRCLYDRAERRGQRRFHESAEEAVAATRQLERELADTDAASVSIAPHSLHGATAEGIVAAAEWAARVDRPFQIHLAEERHDIDYARERYGDTPGRVLQDLGVVSERLCVVHGVWLDAEEIALLGEAGAKLAYNPISNMALGDGITDIESMIRAGVTVGLGCDGPCANHQVNVWQEMRFAEWLQRVDKLRMNVVQAVAGHLTRGPNYCFEMGTRNGGEVLGLPVGEIAPGNWADMVVVDPLDLSLLPHRGHDPETLLNNVVHSMAVRGAVRTVLVAGQEVLSDGRLTGIDEEELAHRTARWAIPA